ncbi:hypothetical protein HHI36_018689 [Cryptolaemus montrouzieri]|uniref:Uncharacterized protein n=1 Tax=Cryptolaemus montrouzieri TaxID=559131 RepID=A0ABD2P1J6_9CUCU
MREGAKGLKNEMMMLSIENDRYCIELKHIKDIPPSSKEIHGKVRIQKPTGDVRVGANVNVISDILVPVLTEEREREGTYSEETLGMNSGGEPECGTEIMNPEAEEFCRKSKITEIGDQYAKSFKEVFGDLGREPKYHIQTTIIGNIEMATLARRVFSEVKNHDGEDYVFFVFKTRNIDNTRTLNMALRYLLPISKFTNLTIVAEVSTVGDDEIICRMKEYIKYYRESQINSSNQLIVSYDRRRSTIRRKVEEVFAGERMRRLAMSSV